MIVIFSNDCEHFQMTVPNLEVADEINKDLTRYEAMWFLMEEFNTGLQELAKEDWISFRYKVCVNSDLFQYHHLCESSH